MLKTKRTTAQQERISTGLPFVQSLARRFASGMPHSIDLNDLVQDGMIGLIDAVHRFDESRGIKFETFAERRVRGAMIDALRRDAWPRGIRRVRREIEAARDLTAMDYSLMHGGTSDPYVNVKLMAKVRGRKRGSWKWVVRTQAIENICDRTFLSETDCL